MIFSLLSTVGDAVSIEDWSWLHIVIGVVIGLGGIKAGSIVKLKRTVKKTAQVIHNLDDMTEDSIHDIIQQSIVEELQVFEQQQDAIVKGLFDRHNECHEEISKDLQYLKDNQTAIITQLFNLGKEFAALRATLEAKVK